MTAHRTTRREIGVNPIAVVFDGWNIVDALQQSASVKNCYDAIAGIGATALEHLALAGGDAPILPHSQLQLDVGLRTRTMGKEILFARQSHHYLSSGGAGEEGGDDFKVQHLDTRSKPTSDEGLHHADARGVHLQ